MYAILCTVAIYRLINVKYRGMNIVVRELKKRCRGRVVREVAKAAGVSRGFIFKVLAGKKKPGPKLLKYLGLEAYEAYRRKPPGTARRTKRS
jgi:hypothetical protein